MIERLKALGESAKGILIFIVTPVLFVIAYIYYLTTKNQNLKQEISHLEANDNIQKTMDQLQEAQHASTDAEADYNRIKSEYLKQQRDGGGQS